FAYQNIGIDQFPNVELPIITVTTTLRGASPEEVETSVTKPLEEVINTIEGVDELSSVSREGVSRITVQFLYERNRDVAAQDVREITYISDKQIKQNLETVLDVGSVDIVGGRTRAVQVAVDVERLRARGLTIDDVRTALGQQNLELPEGRVDQGTRELVVRTLGRMAAVKNFNDLVVANFGGEPILLKDIATVRDDVEEPRSLSRLNGQNSITVVVRKQSGVNTVAVIDRV